MTDNPFLGFSSPYERFRRGFDLFEATGGQLGRVRPPSSVPDEVLRHWLHPTLWKSPGMRERVRKYMANSRNWEDDARSFAARVFRGGADALGTAAKRRPFALVRRHLRAARAVDAAAALRGPLRGPGLPRRRAVDAPLHAHTALAHREPARVPCWTGMRALYAAEVTMTDRWLGVFLERLYELGLERETVIVLVGDHGILLGEHGWTGKISIALYPALAGCRW